MAVPAANGYMMYAEESTVRTWTAPTNTLFVTAKPTQALPEALRKQFFGGSRYAEVGIQMGKVASTAQAQYPLFPTMGQMFVKHALGKAQYNAAITADTTAGSVVTANGVSTFTLTTGSASYVTYGWVLVGTGANQEPARIIAYNNGTKVMQVDGLKINVAAGAGLAVQQPAGHQFQNTISTDTGWSTLPTSSVEMVKGGGSVGGGFSWQRSGCFVKQFALAGNAQFADATLDLVPTSMPIRPGTSTAFAPTTTEIQERGQYFTVCNGKLIVPADPTASGASHVQALLTTDTWSVTVANTVVENKYWDQQQHVVGYPTTGKITVQYHYTNEAGRPTEWDDYLSLPYPKTAPFLVSLAKNIGTVSSPNWMLWGLAIPYMTLTSAIDEETVGNMLMAAIQGEADNQAGGPVCQVFVTNQKLTTY